MWAPAPEQRSRAAMAAGAAVVIAVDAAYGMLAAGARRRPSAVVGDATHLPMRTASADVVLAAFSFNHLADPAAAFAEAARVARPGGAIAVSTYAADDRHPAKAIVEDELGALGWSTPAWYVDSRARADAFATPDACRRAAAAAGLDATVDRVAVPFPELGPGDLVAWRLGMAHHAPFVRGLSAAARCGVLDAGDRTRAGRAIAAALDPPDHRPPLTPALAITWPRQSAARRTQSDTP